MPFGVSWPQYLKFWGVSIAGFVCGSQLVHSIYKPLANADSLVEMEAQKIRESLGLKKPTFDDKLAKVLKQDELYLQSRQPKTNEKNKM